MMKTAETGRNGEALVAEYLRKNGWIIVKRNYHSRYGEIDIIAENSEYIIFTEVKTRSENSLVTPLEAVDAAKRRRLTLTAQDFLSKFGYELQPRFDVAQVITYTRADGSTGYKLDYLENAF